MKMIKQIVEYIYDEIEMAECYAEAAAKAEDDSLKTLYIELANAELGHVDRLHAKAKSTIERVRSDSRAAIPEGMKEIWEWEHERVIDKVAKIKTKLESARTM